MTSPNSSTTVNRPERPGPTFGKPVSGWQLTWYTVIFEADTQAGKRFDLLLIAMILSSVLIVVFDSVHDLHQRYGQLFAIFEWGFTLLFTAEYLARLLCVRHAWRYATSFYGVIDLLAVLPTYLAVLVPGIHVLIDIRVLRLLRVFRILKLTEYVAEYGALGYALIASRRKIFVFLSFVSLVVLIMGTLMYVVEGQENGFTNIPVSIYWAITTMTTVGFGDITPKTDLGRMLASVMMLLGWGTLAVPTGIVSAEFTAQRLVKKPTTRTCHECLSEGHLIRSKFCRDCGAALPPYVHDDES